MVWQKIFGKTSWDGIFCWSKFKRNGKFKLSIEENAIFICVYTVSKAKTLTKLVKNGRKYLSLMADSQKEIYFFRLWQLTYSWYRQMLRGQMLPGQKSPWQSWDIADIEFCGGGVVHKAIFVSNPTKVMLGWGWIKLWFSWGFDHDVGEMSPE